MKKNFHKRAKSYYLHDNNSLFKKVEKKENLIVPNKIQHIKENDIETLLYKISQTSERIHREDNHRGINSLRNILIKGAILLMRSLIYVII